MTEKVNAAPCKWAQRSDSLYLTIALPDVKDETINLSDQELHFTGKSGEKEYEVNIEFYKKVDSAGSTYKVLPRSVQMLLQKDKDDQDEFWPRLLKDKALEKNQVTIDWDRYVDEDEEDEGFDTSNLEGGMGMGGMPGMGGGMPGMGGGPGGMGGMDMEALMKQMGGMGGMDGGMPAGMGDFGGGGGGGDDDDDENDVPNDDDDDDDDDADDLPDLEEVN